MHIHYAELCPPLPLWGRHFVFALSVCPSVTLRFRSITRVPLDTRAFKRHRVIALIEVKIAIDFSVSKSKVKVTVTLRVKSVSAQ